MSDLQRTAQKIEVTMSKALHIRDYENETYNCSLSATFNRAMSPDEGAVEIAKLQAELEYAMFSNLYQRKLITTHDYNVRVDAIKSNLLALGVSKENINYIQGGLQ